MCVQHVTDVLPTRRFEILCNVPLLDVPQDFALGDFDDTAIAQMENEAEAAEEGLGNEVETAGLDDGEDEEEETGVASLVRLPVATTDAEPRPKPRRPLIEEM